MRRQLCLVILFLLPAVVALADGPRFDVDEPDFQFGSVFQGEKVEHVFQFSNTGNDPLLIDRVKSSCGCTAALVSAKEIAPGMTGEVRATFDSTRFHGNVVKTIYVYSNDPERNLVQLHLRGAVKEELHLSARSVTIGPVIPGQTVTSQISLVNKGQQPVTIGPARTTAREVTVEFAQRALKPGEQVDIELVAKVAEGKTAINGYLLIPTGNPRLPELRVPVQVRISQPKD